VKDLSGRSIAQGERVPLGTLPLGVLVVFIIFLARVPVLGSSALVVLIGEIVGSPHVVLEKFCLCRSSRSNAAIYVSFASENGTIGAGETTDNDIYYCLEPPGAWS
jgi:hypothetical protein